MSEKYYVISESELEQLVLSLAALDKKHFEKAEAACRARPADKLLDVVEAAKALNQAMDWGDTYPSIGPEDALIGKALGQALAALEGEG